MKKHFVLLGGLRQRSFGHRSDVSVGEPGAIAQNGRPLHAD
ncbi:MAG: hypothetical protein ACLPJH_19825 [Myxococcaceae bacterium]